MIKYDYDYIVVGSGFGGSVSAMRLSQKGYKVAVIESGKRWKSDDFPKTSFSLSKYVWFPKIFCYGIQRINLLNDVMILSGAGVGGGSLVYANTLYVPPQPFFETPIVQKMGAEKGLLPFYDIAKRMLGVIENPKLWEVDDYMKQTADEMGVGHTFKRTPVGINFHEKDKVDPYFNGEGPERNSCNFCGGCMVGCRFNAKNTLDKNYLYFAEKLGATIIPETKVDKLIPLSPDGGDGYEVQTRSTTGFFGNPRKTFRARNVVLSAGVLGTLGILLKMQQEKIMTRLSPMLGKTVRTNSESLVGVTSLRKGVDFSKGIAITSSIYPDEHTHIEPVRYSAGSDAMGTIAAGTLVDGGKGVPRFLRFLWSCVQHPINTIRFLSPFGFAKKSIILLVMQTVDNSIRIVRKRRLIWPFQKTITSTQETGTHIPTFIPIANEFARRLAKRIGGVARSSLNEVILDIPTTAHILSGCIIGDSPETGVIDLKNQVYGYKNLLICDGSMVPANLGVNPSLTITALSERAMSFVPLASEVKEHRFFDYEKNWKITDALTGKEIKSSETQPKDAEKKENSKSISKPKVSNKDTKAAKPAPAKKKATQVKAKKKIKK
ncbi:MAG TPA: GMC family oxidoreductase [Leptospiraceae bacterium]|nr:GMC family oxidoreductase [Leptospiraceae bacterium]HMW04323.1 GMC family oxidoreductase [Leptospiraceae bacterium]HMX30669.1 GMC family oxidoreductase [Leptospiraceae bacterium]HMY31923.1 GMC family oxidoreductase [Leptospiraceae bacterium]HMZ65378.1 GMC family oxidoreductase [Leptospiraceae bacterium]